MKAFKGCTNKECIAYKKIHYKKEDQFCKKCGNPLLFVCAECWKPMPDDKEKYCISCVTEKEQKQAQRKENIKNAASKVTAVGVAVAVGVAKVGKNADKFVKGAKQVVDAGAEIAKMVKK